ncbi:hypothetical protein VP01_128g2 [Puccinia sorghi]|uniref:Peptidase C14 caspase domain-containing protein n=1 Tax=Puccinia sorghi TaxID=27349 RepID=A0A0L6VQ42_9BASI|nr:hypothetical protein VP01_128g2 [Puccinia sorghi]
MANYPYTHPASQWGPPPITGQQNQYQQQWAPPTGPPPPQWQPPPVPPPGPPPPTNDHARPYPGHYGAYTHLFSYLCQQNSHLNLKTFIFLRPWQSSNHIPPGIQSRPTRRSLSTTPSYPRRTLFSSFYSNCTGRRKALCIGINYVGLTGELRGCHNDALNMQKFLIERYNYKQEDMVVLLDTPGANPRQVPTRANIISAMQWLVSNAQPNDSLFFHFSGHGGQVKDLDGDEDDGFDEVIYPVDHKHAGHIVDDEMFAIMVAPLPPGCRLTGIFDVELLPFILWTILRIPSSCHSGTALDLPCKCLFHRRQDQGAQSFSRVRGAGQGALQAGLSYMRGDLGGVAKGLLGLGKKVMMGNKADKIAKATRTSPADAIQWSGCKDSQTSADAVEAGSATGAMSYAFITSLTQAPQQTYQQLLVSIRHILANKYSQKPQLSASHPIDTNLMFVM